MTHLMPMIVATIEECGLTGPDAAEVNQTVWLRVVEWLEHLRHPAALPKWIDTTTRRECLRVQRTAGQHAHLIGSEDELMSRETEPWTRWRLRCARSSTTRCVPASPNCRTDAVSC
ncbi:hypothetical protein NKG94_16685 [Micromonospora sp. M12]